MKFDKPLIPARLITRYKRFLADVRLENGQVVTAHCANPGSMMGLRQPETPIWVEPNNDPKRKLNYSWKLVELDAGHMAGIDTSVPNKVVGEALRAGRVPQLAVYKTIRPEVRYGKGSRVDFLLSEPGRPDAYVEVKNVHFRRDNDWAEFPDSITARGAKHLAELSDMVAEGHRAIMLYLVQRTDCARFKIAADCDPVYARAFVAAVAAGVEMLCFDTAISTREITLANQLPVDTSL
jgi:sugar fermentation stimulation protein A